MKNYREYCRHILEEIIFIETEIKDISFEQFISNAILKRAIVRSLEIIGEAIKKIPNELTMFYPQIEWKNIARTRDLLIHHYFGVDYHLVWDIIHVHISQLKNVVNDIINRPDIL